MYISTTSYVRKTMIKFYEVKDKHYSGVFKQWGDPALIHYIIEDFSSNASRNVDIRQIIGDIVYHNLCHYLCYADKVSATDRLRVVEARDIAREKLTVLCEQHRYDTPRLLAGLKEYETEIRDCAYDSKSKIWRKEFMDGLGYIERMVDYWNKEDKKMLK